MTITSKKEGNSIIINTPVNLDFSCHNDFKDTYIDSDVSDTIYVIDMSSTSYIDSSGLGILLILRNYAGDDASKVIIRGADEKVKDILLTSKFDHFFTIED